ncbi:transposase-like protein [Dysgonomonas hofstadii]|uniref:Transposase-like protein n=1 Tax=Dysgonomonas hofstadii TaxID=637886 RepID=A0A840CKK8_9BACT|nr:phBC6A51 family helix-turn-helix protein [Dysgonomonas hofstadii]MBB4035701.1 transposase-like protein [Dysgonomonas hofstadii]
MSKYNETLAKKITALIADELCSVSDICKAIGISRNTFYKWKRENPAFNEEIEDAMEYRGEVLLSMAYSSIKERLKRHTVTEEKDTYVPEETDPGKLKFKSRVVCRKERLPDLRTIKMILDRADHKLKMKNEKLKMKNDGQEENRKIVEAKTEAPEIPEKSMNDTDREQAVADNKIPADTKNTSVKNIKNSIKILSDKGYCKSHRKRKYSIKETT